MPVTAFRVKNFMAFGDSKWIELRKINLLYGRNSSGKSVLIRALRLLMQSLTAAENGDPITFVNEGGVDVGSFKAALHNPSQGKPKFHKGFANQADWWKPISFGFMCEISLREIRDRKDLEWVALNERVKSSADGAISFEVNLSFSLNKDAVVVVGFDLWQHETTRWMGEKRRLLTLQLDPDLEPSLSGYSSTHFSSKSSDAVGAYFAFPCQDGFLPKLELDKNSLSDINETEHKQVNEVIQVWSFCKEEIAAFLKSIIYMGPIRPLPERYYLIDERMRQLLRKQSGQAFLKYLDSSESVSLREKIEKWMIAFGLARSIRHKPDTSKETPDRQVVLRELVISESDNSKESQAGSFEINIKDMGFGASQILPVIVTCLTADDEAFIIIEQPELHLHPEAQASAADLFIECVSELTAEEKNREVKEEKGREERNNERDKERVRRRCLIETHSEHILLRLQLRIAGGKPRYFDSDDANSEGRPERLLEEFNLAGRDFGLAFVTRDRKSSVSTIEYIDADPYGRLVGGMTEFGSFFERAFLDSSMFSIVSESKATTAGMEDVK